MIRQERQENKVEQQIKFKVVAKYNGHNVKPSGAVDLNVTVDYSEMKETIQLLQLLNNDIKIDVKKPSEKAFKLGTFRLQNLQYDHDGQAKIRFNSTSDFVEVDNLNRLIPMEKEERFVMRFDSLVELEDDEVEDDEE